MRSRSWLLYIQKSLKAIPKQHHVKFCFKAVPVVRHPKVHFVVLWSDRGRKSARQCYLIYVKDNESKIVYLAKNVICSMVLCSHAQCPKLAFHLAGAAGHPSAATCPPQAALTGCCGVPNGLAGLGLERQTQSSLSLILPLSLRLPYWARFSGPVSAVWTTSSRPGSALNKFLIYCRVSSLAYFFLCTLILLILTFLKLPFKGYKLSSMKFSMCS